MRPNQTYWYHVAAVITAVIWGTTFVSTKVLINYGLSPAEILVYRFALAYIGIWPFCKGKLFADNLKDELLCVAAGLGGGSLYFLFENTALEYTLASNVSFIVSTAPLFTAFLNRACDKTERIKTRLLLGSLVALSGVALVVFNGSFILKIHPLGDVLSVSAALCWAFYGITFKCLTRKGYSTLFITRKVFFYGVLTIVPYLAFRPGDFNLPAVLHFPVAANLLFLGIVASLLCFLMWNAAVKQLGVVQTSNYIYLIPLITLLTSGSIIHEPITPVALIGSCLIVGGVYVAEKKR